VIRQYVRPLLQCIFALILEACTWLLTGLPVNDSNSQLHKKLLCPEKWHCTSRYSPENYDWPINIRNTPLLGYNLQLPC